MTTSTLDTHVAHWLTKRGISETPRIDTLQPGSGHEVWRVRVGSDDWVFRHRVRKFPGYVADFQREQAIWQLAAQNQLAPTLHFVSNDGSLWISDYAPQQSAISAAELGNLCHQIHHLPGVPWQLNLSEQIESYYREAERRGIGLADRDPDDLATHISTLNSGPIALCHNDLLAENVLGAPDAWRIIDWEYAAMGSPYFDAAAVLAPLPASQSTDFLKAAFPDGYDEDLLTAGRAVYAAMDSAWRNLEHASD